MKDSKPTAHLESMVQLAAGDPTLIPLALTEVLDMITEPDPGHNIDRADTLDRIMHELTTDHMVVIQSIAALATLQQAATSGQTFTEWLGTEAARRMTGGRELATLMDGDANWPRHLRTYAEFREYIAQVHTAALRTFEQAWSHYESLVIAPCGDPDTIRTDIQYAARIAWAGGHDEIHPRTADGVARYDAERRAAEYNDEIYVQKRRGVDTVEASAAVVRRTVVYGPWYAI